MKHNCKIPIDIFVGRETEIASVADFFRERRNREKPACDTAVISGEDGLLLSSMIFDEQKYLLKQSWNWLREQDSNSHKINSFILKYHKLTESLGRLRFFLKPEIKSILSRTLEAAEKPHDEKCYAFISEQISSFQQ